MISFRKTTALAIGLLLSTVNLAHAQFQAPLQSGQTEWQRDMDWAGRNTEAGGATNCPALYFAAGIPGNFVAFGGRAALMRYAAGAVAFNPGLADYAYGLVLITQCHNGNARQGLQRVGRDNVLSYLKWKYGV